MSRRAIRCAAAVACGRLLVAFAAAAADEAKPVSYENADFKSLPATLPLVRAGTFLLVDGVRVNGSGPYRFLLDTGAMGGGRVDVSLAAKLGLKQVGEIQSSDGSGRKGPSLPEYRLDSLKLGPIEFVGVRVISRDYNRHGAAAHGHIDGVLGMGLFEQFLLTIDYPASALSIATGALPKPNGKDILPLVPDAPVPSIQVLLSDNSYEARLDTGAMGGISVSAEIASRLKFIDEPKQVGEARTVAGPFKIERATLDGTLRIGDRVINNPEITIAGPMKNVNLGGPFLQDFAITLDQKHDRIRFQRAAPAASRSASSDPAEVVVDLEMEKGRPVISALVNGKGPFRFILDTGAATTVLNADFARKLKLKSTGTTRIGDPSNPTAIEAAIHTIDKLAMGGLTFSRVSAVSWDDKAIQHGIGDVCGVMGFPALADYVVTFDFPGRKLRLSKLPLTAADGSVPYTTNGENIPTIDVDAAGERVETHIDTGNAGEISLPRRLAKSFTFSGEPRSARARTASGEFEVLIARIDGEITIAGQTIRDPTVHFNDRFKWGNIGSGLLSRFVVSIDQQNRRIRLTPSGTSPPQPVRRVVAAPGGDPSRKRYGILAAVSSAGPMEVHGTIPDSIAEKAGLKKGDIILRINGQEVADLEMEQRGELLRASPVTMVIQRDGREIELSMSLDEPPPTKPAERTRVAPRKKDAANTINLLLPPSPAVAVTPWEKMKQAVSGRFRVEARMWKSPNSPPVTISGTSTWSFAHDRYLHEVFELSVNGRELKGEAFLGPAGDAGVYELVQVDAFNPQMFHVRGKWNDAASSLTMESITPDSRPLRWSYRWSNDGAFTKEMHLRDPDGAWRLASDYKYTPIDPK